MLSKKERAQLEKKMEDLLDEDGNITFHKNPKVDHCFGLYDCLVPTKQDAFKPLDAFAKAEDGTEYPIKHLYEKNEDTEAIKLFTEHIQQVASNIFKDDKRIKKPNLVEVVINVSTLPRRFKEVDVDNLAKCVLDGLNGIAFDDDSQVSRLLCEKHIHPMEKDGVFIAITKLTNERNGIIGQLHLFSANEWDNFEG